MTEPKACGPLVLREIRRGVFFRVCQACGVRWNVGLEPDTALRSHYWWPAEQRVEVRT